nr:retrovirus-related Pol polyprotein from transposon TNT 1-94 [Tanacetum cinerariifolium]
MSEKGMSILSKKNVLSGVHDINLKKCSHCLAGKQTRRAFKSHPSFRMENILDLVHSDVCGPMKTKTLGLPASFWGGALNMAVHVINLTTYVPLRFDVPNRVWSGTDVSYSHLRVFGCKESVHIPKDERSKLGVKNKPCVFLEYGQDELGYRLYDPV